jgi:hypothetical protein
VLLTITAMNVFAVAFGIHKLKDQGAIWTFAGCQDQNIQMIALVFAFIEATPGLLFIMCARPPRCNFGSCSSRMCCSCYSKAACVCGWIL